MNRKEKRMKTERMLVFATTLLGAVTADAVDANVRFAGGGYDGYGKQDSGTLNMNAMSTDDRFTGGSYDGYDKRDSGALDIPAAPIKGTLIRIF